MSQASKETYRVQGFTCANCASTFEKNIKRIDGVEDATVNFGASKVTVHGEASISDLEKAGSFENLKVTPEHSFTPGENKQSIWQAYRQEWFTLFLVLAGFASHLTVGESYLTILLFLAAVVVGGTSLFITGLTNIRHLQFDMKTLMTIAIIGAVNIGEWGEAAVVVLLFAISEALESYSMDKARYSIQSLMALTPDEAWVRRSGKEFMIPTKDIQVGDVLLVKPGQKVAMDGYILNGHSAIEEAAITGEAIPVEKRVEDNVFAGTLNKEGFLEVYVTKTSEDTTLAKIIHLVEEAQAEKAPSQHFVDRFATYYTPAIMIAALAIAVVPPLFFGAVWSTWVYQGLAVLVVGCPCALVISTPVSIVTAIGNAAKQGVLVKGGVYLEEMGKIQSLAFDKTGTLTKGYPEVTDLQLIHSNNAKQTLTWMAALETKSHHPLASAILEKAAQEGVMDAAEQLSVHDLQSVTGKGIKASIEQKPYFIGAVDDMSATLPHDAASRVDQWRSEGKTVMMAVSGDHIEALIAVKDTVRDDSKAIVHRLHQLGIKHTIMLTGDHAKTAEQMAQETGVSRYEAELLPHEKRDYIKHYHQQYGSVAMIGDGVNDAPALAASNVGIAMGGAGTDTALETADIALMGDDLSKLPFTVKLSRKTLGNIKQNISFALIIKLIALLLVIPGWLTLWIAIVADMGATLLVTLNGLRLLRVKGDD
ncbi:heavy metal translocating P-type ATPase [Thalassobacillus sp. CUG 92003]|uniref:heavy metal translocating P-type ATPase n=1 Tax=Thalassobacillus sp. CUG 92003 TaxID=2736641 RepID=UPI0015E7A5C1|nr:heavy metal translocating P-type ATPase [Thalassobacillus sp. CUG 92003]